MRQLKEFFFKDFFIIGVIACATETERIRPIQSLLTLFVDNAGDQTISPKLKKKNF